MKKNMVRVVVLGILFFGLACLGGCQADVNLGSASIKGIYKGENNNQEHKSRDAGMSSSTGYRMSWGRFGEDK